MTITTEPFVPDGAAELLAEKLPELELLHTGDGEQLAIENLDPDCLIPVARDFDGNVVEFTAEEVADLTASVQVLGGFLQPGLAIPIPAEPAATETGDGEPGDSDPGDDGPVEPKQLYRLLIGNRRRVAAKVLGRKLPCIVVKSAETAQQILAILHENDARLDLKPSQRAALYQQLTLVDWTPQMIAKASGHKNAKQVTQALSLVELPPAAKAAADNGQLDLTLAAQLSEFADDPKILAKIIDKGNSTWGFQHAISDARSRKQKDDAADMIFAELTMAGVKVTSKPKDFGYSSREADISGLVDANGNRLDPAEVRTKPGFAAFINKQAYGGPTATIYCIDPEKYGYGRVGHSSYVPDEEKRRKEQEAAAKQALKEGLAAASAVRRKFLATAYGSAKAAKANYLLALRAAVAEPDDINPANNYFELIDAVAGCAVRDHAQTAGIDRLTRMLVARWVAKDEENLDDIATGRQYGVDHGAAWEYLNRLVAAGYELSDAETQLHALLEPKPEEAVSDDDEDGETEGEEDDEDQDDEEDEDEDEEDEGDTDEEGEA